MTRPISDQQRIFVRAYVDNGRNAKAAAIVAGVSETSAKVMGSRWLKREDVQHELARLSAETLETVNRAVHHELTRPVNLAMVNDTEREPDPAPTGDPAVDDEVRIIVRRAWVVTRLMKNAQVCLGELPAKVTTTPRATEADPNPSPVTKEVHLHDSAGANRALELLMKEVEHEEARPEAGQTIEGELAEPSPLRLALQAFREKRGLDAPPDDYDPTQEASYP